MEVGPRLDIQRGNLLVTESRVGGNVKMLEHIGADDVEVDGRVDHMRPRKDTTAMDVLLEAAPVLAYCDAGTPGTGLRGGLPASGGMSVHTCPPITLN